PVGPSPAAPDADNFHHRLHASVTTRSESPGPLKHPAVRCALLGARTSRDVRRTMRQIMIFAAMLLALAVIAAKYADQTAHQTAARAAIAASPAPPQSSGSSVTIARDARGHFEVDGRIDGRRLGFMVDTGASVIALRARDAAMLGIHPAARDF